MTYIHSITASFNSAKTGNKPYVPNGTTEMTHGLSEHGILCDKKEEEKAFHTLI